MQKGESRWREILLSTILLGALCGMLLTIVLMEHHRGGAERAFVTEVCGSDPDSGCNAVNRSPGSKFLGLPVAWWGWLYYSTILCLLFAYFIWREALLLQLMLLLGTVAVLTDLGLFLYSILALGTVCNLCVLSYAATVLTILPTYAIIRDFRKTKETFMSYFPQNTRSSWPRLRKAALLVVSGVIVAAVSGLMYCSEPKEAPQDHGRSQQDYNALLNAAYQDFLKAYLENPKVELGNAVGGKRGPAGAILKIHEFADPLCPYCGLMGMKLKAIAEKYPADIQIIYRHFPLDNTCNKTMQKQLHAGACELSYAMQCAGAQGKFFEVHDEIFADQKGWSQKANLAALKELAVSKGANAAAFQNCFTSAAAKAAVTGDISTGIKLNVTGTPTLFVNGRRLPNVHIDFLEVFLSKLIESEKQRR